MKAVLLVLIFLILFFNSCSHTYLINKNSPPDSTLNTKLSGKPGHLLLKDESRKNVHFVGISTDSLAVDTGSGKIAKYAHNQIKEYRVVDRSKAIGTTFSATGIAAATGFVIGCLLYVDRSESDKEIGDISFRGDSRLEQGGISAAGFAAPFLIFGLPLAAITGYQHIFYFGEKYREKDGTVSEIVRVRIDQLLEESEEFVRFRRSERIMKLNKTDIFQIERVEDRIYIVLPLPVYMDKF